MKPDRLNALTDGVVAIAITIVVLELPVPHEATWAGLRAIGPMLLTYVLSFVNIGIFWNNQHHVMATAKHIDSRVMWFSLSLLFFLSLVPFVIRWMDEAGFESFPVAAYGVVMVGAAISYQMIERSLMAIHGDDDTLAQAVGDDWKGKLSLAGFIAGVGLAFWSPLVALGLYVVIAASWFTPDRRIEKQLVEDKHAGKHPGA